MEIRTEIDSEKNVRAHKVQGLIDVRELKRELANIYQSPGHDPGMNSLWDLRGADFFSVTSAEVQSLIEMVKEQWGKGGTNRAALVVTKEVGYGLSRMYEIIMSGVSSSNVRVFREYDEAVKWLEE